ncbi:MAG TPA: hypothetical protein VN724_18710 [Pyrinomonadaceae bacterium]|jgi:hypothetical protein|nr:hypothetical protein [Pyrinomonadaceae bacterium]
MKKRKKTKKTDSATSARRLPALIALALVVVVIGAISAVSRQLVAGKQSQPESPEALRDSSSKSYRTVKVAGQDVQVDPQTGKLKPLTQQEAQELAAGLKKMLNKSAEGLTETQNADGSTTMDLEGRFQHVVVAREREDGSLSMSCVDNPKQAASAMGIDPKLFGIDGTPGATKQNQKTRQRN